MSKMKRIEYTRGDGDDQVIVSAEIELGDGDNPDAEFERLRNWVEEKLKLERTRL